jgi:tetratricopeptide (TPR) repeat protein
LLFGSRIGAGTRMLNQFSSGHWQLAQKILGKEHPDTLSSMNNLAQTLKAQGDLAGARTLEEQVLEARARLLCKEHQDTLSSMLNLAKLLSVTNRLAEAEPLYRQVLRILAEFGHRTGHEHPHFRTAINNYAGLISAMGLSQDAIATRVLSAIEGRAGGIGLRPNPHE